MKARDISWASRDPNDPASWDWSTTDKGKRHSNLQNVGVALSHDATLQHIAWYDEFLDRLLTGPGREWTDHDDVEICVKLQDAYGLISVKPTMVREMLACRAARDPRHVVREYLQGLTWDRVPRIQEAFIDHWGAEPGPDQPEEYLKAASANYFISLIARVLRPGCKVDTMPVFEGAQGIFKSSALEALGGRWFSVSHESMGTKDFYQSLRGIWIAELSELDTMNRAEVTKVKSVISTRVDRYRPSYTRNAVDFPRQCVFAGTTNTDNWGRDETGLRRFWPIKCGLINLTTLRAARDQLFAEAAILFNLKAPWWVMPSSTATVQSDRQFEHVWRELIEPWLLGKTEVTTLDVLVGAVKMDQAKVTVGHQQDAARVLRLLGWDSKLKRVGQDKKPTRIWFEKPSVTVTGSEPLQSKPLIL